MTELQARGHTGRPQDDIPHVVVEKIRGYAAEHKRAPSSNWVYKLTREMFQRGFNREKVKRALDMAIDGMEIVSAIPAKRPKPKPGRCQRCKIILATIGDPPSAKLCRWCKEELSHAIG